MSTAEIAGLLGIGTSGVRRWYQRGYIPLAPGGGAKRSDVVRWLTETELGQTYLRRALAAKLAPLR